jgi:hypothetical protein
VTGDEPTEGDALFDLEPSAEPEKGRPLNPLTDPEAA